MVTDVYAAGEAPRAGVTGKLVVDAVLDARPWKRVAWLPRRDDVLAWLGAELRPGDLCLTLGAGDITSLPDDVIAGIGGRGVTTLASPTAGRAALGRPGPPRRRRSGR